MPVHRRIASVLCLVPLAASCGKKAPPPPPPAEVSVVSVAPRTVNQVLEFSGEVEASRRVIVRARVTGVIQHRPFVEGSEVRAGQVLYRIDPTTYDADWRSAKARLAEAEARQTNAEQNLQRLQPLLADNAVARQDYDNAESEAKQAHAAVEDARAAVDRTRKDLDETTVRAELAGRVGKTNLEVGARVRGPDDTLTTIDVLDPTYVIFRPSAQEQLAWQRDPKASRMLQPGGGVKVEAILPDNSPAPTTGRIGFVDPVVDPATGTRAYRAEFPNPQHFLRPGQFVRVRLLGLTLDSVIVVPQRAVLRQMGRQLVYVVSQGDTVRARDVRTSAWVGDQVVIQQGLAAGDRVIVDGLQKVGPGRVVRPVALADTAVTASSGQGAAGAGGAGGGPR